MIFFVSCLLTIGKKWESENNVNQVSVFHGVQYDRDGKASFLAQSPVGFPILVWCISLIEYQDVLDKVAFIYYMLKL